MLKWDVYGQEEKHLNLSKVFTWVTVAIYIGAFSFVFILWFRWIRLIMEFGQTLSFWLH